MKLNHLLFVINFLLFFVNNCFGCVIPFSTINFATKAVLEHFKLNHKLLKNDGTILGFHHYQINSDNIENIGDVKICKLYKNLWIITNQDINSYHSGWIIYNGKQIDQKSFFPCNWSPEQLKEKLSTLKLENEQTDDLNQKIFKKNFFLDNQKLETIILKTGNKLSVKSIYPVVNSDLKSFDINQIIEKRKNENVENKFEFEFKEEVIEKTFIENAVENWDIDEFTIQLPEELTETILNEILEQAIRYYKPNYFIFALDLGATANQQTLARILKKQTDSKKQVPMIKALLEKNIHFNDEAIKLALATNDKEILEVLIFDFGFTEQLDKIPANVKNNKICSQIIQNLPALKTALERAIYFKNIDKINELSTNALSKNLQDALDFAKSENNGMDYLIEKEINRRKEEKAKEKNLEYEKFIKLMQSKVNDVNQEIEFTKDELEIVKKFKNKVLTPKGTTPILSCISKGKFNLFKQVFDLGIDLECPTFDEQKKILTRNILDFAFEKEIEPNNQLNKYHNAIIHFICNKINIIKFLDQWIETEQGFNKCLLFFQNYKDKFIEWLFTSLKNPYLTLNKFNDLLSNFPEIINYTPQGKNILVFAAQADRIDMVEDLLFNKKMSEYIVTADKEIKIIDLLDKGSKCYAIFEKIENQKEINRNNQIKEKEEKEEKEKKERATQLAKKKGWTELIRSIQEDASIEQIKEKITNNDNLFVTDNDGMDAQAHAEKKGLDSIVKYIQKIKDNIHCQKMVSQGTWNKLNEAAFKKNETDFKLLLKKEKKVSIFELELPVEYNKETIKLYMDLLNPTQNENVVHQTLMIIARNFYDGNNGFSKNPNLALDIYKQIYKLTPSISMAQKIKNLAKELNLEDVNFEYTKEILSYDNEEPHVILNSQLDTLQFILNDVLPVENVDELLEKILNNEAATIKDKFFAKYYCVLIYNKFKQTEKIQNLLEEIIEINRKNNFLLPKQADEILYRLITIYFDNKINLNKLPAMLEELITNANLDMDILSQSAFALFDLYDDFNKKLELAEKIYNNKEKYKSQINLRAAFELLNNYYESCSDTKFIITNLFKSKVTKLIQDFLTLYNKDSKFNSTKIFFKIGVIYFKIGKFDYAIKYLQQFIELDNKKENLQKDESMIRNAKAILIDLYSTYLIDGSKAIKEAVLCLQDNHKEETKMVNYSIKNLLTNNILTDSCIDEILENKNLFTQEIITLATKNRNYNKLKEQLDNQNLTINEKAKITLELAKNLNDSPSQLCNKANKLLKIMSYNPSEIDLSIRVQILLELARIYSIQNTTLNNFDEFLDCCTKLQKIITKEKVEQIEIENIQKSLDNIIKYVFENRDPAILGKYTYSILQEPIFSQDTKKMVEDSFYNLIKEDISEIHKLHILKILIELNVRLYNHNNQTDYYKKSQQLLFEFKNFKANDTYKSIWTELSELFEIFGPGKNIEFNYLLEKLKSVKHTSNKLAIEHCLHDKYLQRATLKNQSVKLLNMCKEILNNKFISDTFQSCLIQAIESLLQKPDLIKECLLTLLAFYNSKDNCLISHKKAYFILRILISKYEDSSLNENELKCINYGMKRVNKVHGDLNLNNWTDIPETMKPLMAKAMEKDIQENMDNKVKYTLQSLKIENPRERVEELELILKKETTIENEIHEQIDAQLTLAHIYSNLSYNLLNLPRSFYLINEVYSNQNTEEDKITIANGIIKNIFEVAFRILESRFDSDNCKFIIEISTNIILKKYLYSLDGLKEYIINLLEKNLNLFVITDQKTAIITLISNYYFENQQLEKSKFYAHLITNIESNNEEILSEKKDNIEAKD